MAAGQRGTGSLKTMTPIRLRHSVFSAALSFGQLEVLFGCMIEHSFVAPRTVTPSMRQWAADRKRESRLNICSSFEKL